MNAHASYIFSSYSTVLSRSKDNILQVGDLSADGIPIPSFDEDLLINLCTETKAIFENENNIVNVNGDTIIVGDIHGSLHDLLRILNFIEVDHSKVLFLGDYVDRGNFSLECVILLFSLKVLHPNSFFLIRGNHEFDCICSEYGFKKEILNYHNPIHETALSFEKENKTHHNSDVNANDSYFANHININCYKYTEKLYNAFLEVFSYLPICAIINNTTICIHGGLSPQLSKVSDIQKNIHRPIVDFKDNELFGDLLWSDPSRDLSHLYHENPRGFGKLFNGVTVTTFLKNNNLKRLVRGHECVNNGYHKVFNDKCITVFSASSYSPGLNNKCGLLKIYQINDKIQTITFDPLPRLKKCDASYYKVQSFDEMEFTKPVLSFFNRIAGSSSIPPETVETLEIDSESNTTREIFKSCALFTESKIPHHRRASLMVPINPYKIRKEKASGSLKNVALINHSFNTGIMNKISSNLSNAYKYVHGQIPKIPNNNVYTNLSPIGSETDENDMDVLSDNDEEKPDGQECLPSLF